VKSFASIKASIEYLNQFRDPAQLIEDEQVTFLLTLAKQTVGKLFFLLGLKAILALVDINDMYRRKTDQINTIMEGKLQIILKDVFILLHEKFLEYILKQEYDINQENTNTYFTSFHLIVDLIEILIVSSKEFATTFHMV